MSDWRQIIHREAAGGCGGVAFVYHNPQMHRRIVTEDARSVTGERMGEPGDPIICGTCGRATEAYSLVIGEPCDPPPCMS